MSTEPSTSDVASALATFQPTQAALAELVANSAPLLHAKDATADQIHAARMPLKNARVEIERRRKDLIAPALEFQRAVNDHAKSLVALIEPTETQLEVYQRALEAQEREVKERKRREALATAEAWSRRFWAVGVHKAISDCMDGVADFAALQSELDAATAAHEARAREEAELRAQREAEEQERARKAAEEREAVRREREALEAERKAEAEKRAAEARALAEARAREEAELRAQREALAAQQRALDEQRAAAEAAARAQAAAEAQARAAAERKARALAAAPLAAQVRDLAERVRGLDGPPNDARSLAIIVGAASDLRRYAEELEAGEVAL